MKTAIAIVACAVCVAASVTNAVAQGLGGAGTVQGVVKDPSGGVMVSVPVELSNPVSGFKRTATTDATGHFIFANLPPNPYHIKAATQGFAPFEGDVDVRTAVPIEFDVTLKLSAATESVSVEAHAEDVLERDPMAHTDVDASLISKMALDSSSGLNQVVTMASPGVVADSNGFFHPVGDHAQTQFSIDNQPVTDQQSRLYSNQISQDAVESMEVITGVPTAEYGDKSSLIVHIVTRSGLNQRRPAGSAMFGYGSFRSPTAEVNLGAGSKEVGDFFSLNGMRTDRYLDAPEFTVLHGGGSNTSFFDRLDVHPTDVDSFHVNIQAAKSSFAVPNTFDQQAAGQDQHQSINTFNFAPGYVRVLGSKGVLTANGFVRRDHLTYTPSANPFADLPGTVSQDRMLTNFGGKVDFEFISGRHDVKTGGTVAATRLNEHFTLGVTDPTDPTWANQNGNFDPTFAPYDLTNGGSPFVFSGAATIKTQAAYIQDTIKAGNATFNLGLRVDHYDGLSRDTLAEPRLGASYLVQKTGTVLRASYGRTLETPYNENLLLSSGFGGAAALVGSGNPPPPGRRNEGELGIQQGIGRWVVVDFGYFNKHTVNGYDFSVLFNTPIVFPVAWDHSRLNGFTGRVNLIEHKGFSAYVVMAHTNAIFSPPATGGVLLEQPEGDFRIDHDQKFNSTTNVQYTFDKRVGAWATLAWRYDSGLVAGSVPDYATALTLTANQQATIGLFCGNVTATLAAPITSCDSPSFGAARLVIPGTPANPAPADDVANPPRIAPRHLFDLAIGADNLFNGSKTKVRLRFSVVNLMNKEALYNFLSTFSGTHFVTPRAYQVQLGVAF